MKNVIFTLLFILSISIVVAQNHNQFDTNKKRHGIWKKNYDNGNIRYRGEFNHGKEIGIFKYYSIATSKHPIIIKEFSTSNNTATVKFYTKSGKLESKGTMDGKSRIGKWLYYHKDGKTVMQEESYLNNKLEGSYKTFFPNKKPTILANYKNGKLEGTYKRYSINNVLYQDLLYKDGKLEGEVTYYDRLTGEITEKGPYKNDLRVGTWSLYIDGEFSHTYEIIDKLGTKN